MLDTASQQRFARGCAEASLGYATAATAAYSQLASQALDFWCTALSGLVEEKSGDRDAPKPSASPAPCGEMPFGMSLADWTPFPWFDGRRVQAMFNFDTSTPPPVAFLALANAFPLRGSSASWPFAQAMIESGVPRAVAWPAAEANAAALDAADVASNGFRQIVASYHTESGYATAMTGMTPTIGALMLTAGIYMTPLTTISDWPRFFGG